MDDYYDLGSFGRTVSTASAEAQLWFSRGLLWAYAFSHEEAARCFRKAAEADPDCAMVYWGLGYAVGPYYNKQWHRFDALDLRQTLAKSHAAAQAALARVERASPVERALIEALARRYPADRPPADFGLWNDDYADAMREAYRGFPDDADVCVIFADAMMNRTPWALWDLETGAPAPGADTLEAIAVVDGKIRQMEAAGEPEHPGLLHLYIHLMEMSPRPELALRAADGLRDLAPDAGHFRHMPTHIDAQCGDYLNVVASNSAAIEADRKMLAREGKMNFQALSRAHNFHFKLYGAMFLGQYGAAREAAEGLVETIPEALLRVESPPMADWLEGYVAMNVHARIRFGKWREIIALELPRDRALYCTTTALLHYAKGLAHAVLGEIRAADEEQQHFTTAVARVPASRTVFNNTCLDILAIAAEMLAGEIAYRKGAHEAAFAHLRTAVALADELPYDEPWGWMQPARHALGALLLEQGRVAEAEAVYRADLGLEDTLIRACRHPDNVWSLHGLHECLRRLGKTAEADLIAPRLAFAEARADVAIKASCLCRLQVAV